jgi:hypothetical protein
MKIRQWLSSDLPFQPYVLSLPANLGPSKVILGPQACHTVFHLLHFISVIEILCYSCSPCVSLLIGCLGSAVLVQLAENYSKFLFLPPYSTSCGFQFLVVFPTVVHLELSFTCLITSLSPSLDSGQWAPPGRGLVLDFLISQVPGKVPDILHVLVNTFTMNVWVDAWVDKTWSTYITRLSNKEGSWDP